MMFCSDFLQNP